MRGLRVHPDKGNRSKSRLVLRQKETKGLGRGHEKQLKISFSRLVKPLGLQQDLAPNGASAVRAGRDSKNHTILNKCRRGLAEEVIGRLEN